MAIEILTGNTYPSIATLRELGNKISQRTTAVTVTESFATVDAVKGAPVLTITDSTGVAAKIAMVGLELANATDVLGLPQNSYTPHVIKVVLRTGSGGVPPAILYGALLGEVYKTGTKVEFVTAAAPADTNFADAPAAVWVNDVFWEYQNSL